MIIYILNLEIIHAVSRITCLYIKFPTWNTENVQLSSHYLKKWGLR